MRKPRKIIPGVKYHIIARANRGEMILKSKELKEMFLKIVQRSRVKYKFVIYNFCIMGNHFHIILKPLEGQNLSKIMQWILSVFAVKYNKTFNFKGHVWYDRFKSKIINNIRQYVVTFLYIMQNPVRAELVKDPLDFEYNGITFYINGIMDLFKPP